MGSSDLTSDTPAVANDEATGDDGAAGAKPRTPGRRGAKKLKALTHAATSAGALELRALGTVDVPTRRPSAPGGAEIDPPEPPDLDLGEREPADSRDDEADKRSRRGRRSGDRRARRQTDGRRARRRAAKEREELLRTSPAARRAELAATAAAIAQEQASAEGESTPAAPKRRGKIARRIRGLVAILMMPAAVLALMTLGSPPRELPREDVSYIAKQLIVADQRVRAALVRLRDDGTTPALARTRDATLATRSLAIEARSYDGPLTRRLRRALRLEAAWLDAVGSTLANPRSDLRRQLVARDAAARRALATLPATAGRRTGGAAHLVDYARSRDRAVRAGTRKR